LSSKLSNKGKDQQIHTPPTTKLKVLIIDDEKHFTSELSEFLNNIGFEAFEANTGQQGLKMLNNTMMDLLILDIRLPGMNGLDILKDVMEKFRDLEVIVVSGHGDMQTVIQAMRLGALDYLEKPLRHYDIQIAIERTGKFLRLQQKLRLVEEKNSLISKNLEELINRPFVGSSKIIQEVLEVAKTAALYPDTHVLITGESGTGKENIARIIHYTSSRKDNMFCAVNSSSISDSLLESEFFGHKKGSFTGAITDKKGFFEVSHNGTLFLDEIADMPSNLQAKILRTIEEKVVTRVGDTEPIYTDFRVISATNFDLDKLVSEKIFRLDLLHRLNTIHIDVPPLRERPEDIKPLLDYFISEFSSRLKKSAPSYSKEVLDFLMGYDYPGNVRELKNMIERALILCKSDHLSVMDFPMKSQVLSNKNIQTSNFNIETNERSLIQEALVKCSFNQISAAQLLGISRDALIRKMKKYEITIKKSEA